MKRLLNLSRPDLILISAIAIGLIGLVLFIFTAPELHFPSGQEEAVKIYYADNVSRAHRRLVDSFNEQHRGRVEVVPVNLPFSKFSTNERKEIMTRALRSKSTRLDIFAVDLIWVPRFARWSTPLEDFYTDAELANLALFALQSSWYQSHLYGAPFYIDVGMMYYRRDLLSRLPNYQALQKKLSTSITWEEMLEIAEAREFRNQPFYLFAAEPFEGLMCSFIEMVVGQGGSIIQGDSLRLNTPACRRGLQLMIELINERKLTPSQALHYQEVDVYDYAMKNDALFFRGWPGFLPQYRSIFPVKMDYIGMAMVPHFRNGSPAAVFGGWNLMISKFSKKQKQAMMFVKFVQSLAAQKLIFEQSGFLPINNNVYADSTFISRFPELAVQRRMLDVGFHRPALQEYTKISDIITFWLHEALQGHVSASEALTRAEQQIRNEHIAIK